MLALPRENKQISHFFVFYLITQMQLGVGLLGFERYIVKDSGYDSWIAIILAGLAVHLLLWICYQILMKGKNDLIVIQRNLFGKWLGGFFSIVILAYFTLLVVTITRTYVEIIEVWMFPNLSRWLMIALILGIAYSYVIGGFRVVTGICVLGFYFALPLFLLKYYPIQQGHLSNLFPIMDHSFTDILKSSKTMTLEYLGFELIFLFYPFIKNPEKSQKWAHFGVAFSSFTYLVSALVSFGYFNQQQISHTIWPTLTLWKIVNLSFVERFEYIGIAIWLFVVLPNICIGIWAVSRGIKQLFSLKQKHGIIGICVVVWFLSGLLVDRQQIDTFNTITSRIGFYILYVYIPLLYVLQIIITKVRKSSNE